MRRDLLPPRTREERDLQAQLSLEASKFTNPSYTQAEWEEVSKFPWPAGKIITKDNMHFMGIDQSIYDAFCEVAHKHKCLIFIRSTNSGVIEGFLSGTVTGKTMVTKGKSSEYLPIKSNIAFFSLLSKAPPKRLWNEYSEEGEQDKLLHVPFDTAIPLSATAKVPEFLFIPKILSWNQIQYKFGFAPLDPSGNPIYSAHPPDWIQMTANSASGLATITTSDNAAQKKIIFNPGDLADSIRYVQADADPAAAQGPAAGQVAEFIWIKQSSFADINQRFNQTMGAMFQNFSGNLVQPRYSRRTSNNDSAASGQLPPEQQADTTYYVLYVAESSVQTAVRSARATLGWSDPVHPLIPDTATPDPHYSGTPLVNNADQIAIGRQRCLEIFAPKLNNLGTLPSPSYRLASVLAQGKPQSDGTVTYYEIVADYDLFCICPSVDLLPSPRDLSTLPDLTEFLPSFQEGMGLVSPFEQKVKQELNRVMHRLANPDAPESADAQGATEVVLHGAEVNNYLYVQDFDSLICILPTKLANPRFNILSETFVNMARKYVIHEYAVPVNKLSDTYYYSPIRSIDCNLCQFYLFIYNLQWGYLDDLNHKYLYDKLKPAQLLDDLLLIGLSRLKYDKLFQSTSDDDGYDSDMKTLQQRVNREIYRMFFYARYYNHIFDQLSMKMKVPVEDEIRNYDRPSLLNSQKNVQYIVTTFNSFLAGYQSIVAAINAFRRDIHRFWFRFDRFPNDRASPPEPPGDQQKWIANQTTIDRIIRDGFSLESRVTETPISDAILQREKDKLLTALSDQSIDQAYRSDVMKRYTLDQLSYYPDYDTCLSSRKLLELVYGEAITALQDINNKIAPPTNILQLINSLIKPPRS
jgi:hypothetical protein